MIYEVRNLFMNKDLVVKIETDGRNPVALFKTVFNRTKAYVKNFRYYEKKI